MEGNYNANAVRLIEAWVKGIVDEAIAAHEAKSESSDFANSHVKA